jgi:hypothetical protein
MVVEVARAVSWAETVSAAWVYIRTAPEVGGGVAPGRLHPARVHTSRKKLAHR